MNKTYHFIGIGGSGMGPLASLMLTKGFQVQGSDMKGNEITLSLRQQGAKIFDGHNTENIKNADTVVYSSAIKEDNPELQAAKDQGLPYLKRAELLAQIMQDKKVIAVAGAHGKTTTSSMISHLLSEAGLDPTTMVGGYAPGDSYNALVGKGDYFVAELDESDGSFLLSSPNIAVMTNVDQEHMDYYKSWDNLIEAYCQFMDKVQEKGSIIICAEDQELWNLAQKSSRKIIGYGLSEDFDIYAKVVSYDDFSSKFQYFINGHKKGEIELNVPGRHNIINALGCVAVAHLLSVDESIVRKSLASFQNVRRRFQLKGKCSDVVVIDDYGHHPTEIAATIQTAKNIKKKRLITVFQPHRFSRTQLLMKELIQALIESEYLIVTDIYEASEKPIEGINTQVMFEQIKRVHPGHIVYLPKDKICKYLLGFVESGDVVLTMGAGDVHVIGEELLRNLKKHSKRRV